MAYDLAGKKVLVVGLGRSGRGAAQLARQHGARVVGVDLRIGLDPIDGVVLELGPHRRERFLWADLIVVSPGVPPTAPDLVAARQAGVPMVGELALAWSFLDDVPSIGITGTNGKSTVTHFTGQLLRLAGMEAFVGGNLGTPLSDAALSPLRPEALVVEVSSYQLELPGGIAPDVGVVLNLTPDHLARHGDMDGYARAKTELFRRQGPRQWAVLPHGEERLVRAMPETRARRGWLGAHPGVVRDGDRAVVDLGEGEVVYDLAGLQVLGEHNKDNAATAALLATAVGVAADAVQAGLAHLTALSHRMEPVHEEDGVLWVDDSKATNIDAARVGISGLERAAVVLLGGELKDGSDFAELAPLLRRHRAVLAFGEGAPTVVRQLTEAGIDVEWIDDLRDAMDRARELVRPGDAVLLSPGGASFDAFDDFEHRGRCFAAWARGEDA